jgi:type IV pilus assembly protein PilZ
VSLARAAEAGYALLMALRDSQAGDERRRQARAAIELKVEYQRLNTFFADYTKNISKGGTFIGTERPLPVGTEFVFALGLPGLEEPLRLRGKVIWIVSVSEATKSNPAGMGIEFIYSDEAERTRMEGIVEELFVAHLGEHLASKLLSE